MLLIGVLSAAYRGYGGLDLRVHVGHYAHDGRTLGQALGVPVGGLARGDGQHELILCDELSDLVKKPLHHLRLDREDDDLRLFHDLGGRAAGDDAVLFLQGKGLCLAAVIAVKIVVPELPAVRHAGDYRPRHVAQSDKAVFHMSIPSHILFFSSIYCSIVRLKAQGQIKSREKLC